MGFNLICTFLFVIVLFMLVYSYDDNIKIIDARNQESFMAVDGSCTGCSLGTVGNVLEPSGSQREYFDVSPLKACAPKKFGDPIESFNGSYDPLATVSCSPNASRGSIEGLIEPFGAPLLTEGFGSWPKSYLDPTDEYEKLGIKYNYLEGAGNSYIDGSIANLAMADIHCPEGSDIYLDYSKCNDYAVSGSILPPNDMLKSLIGKSYRDNVVYQDYSMTADEAAATTGVLVQKDKNKAWAPIRTFEHDSKAL